MFRLKGFTSFQLRKEYPHLKKIPFPTPEGVGAAARTNSVIWQELG